MDGLVADTLMIEAIAAAKERRVGIVSYLVEHNMADAREIAIAASQEFGAPLLDLDSIQPDLDTVRIVSEKMLRKHRVLPLVKRGKKLFIAISDPTNLHALDEVKFATGFSIEAVVVEEDKLNKLLDALARAGRHVDAGTRRRRLRDGRSRGLRGRRRRRRQGVERSPTRRRRADRPLHQQGDAGRDQEGRLGHPLRALRAQPTASASVSTAS